jgi:hypothetical protein
MSNERENFEYGIVELKLKENFYYCLWSDSGPVDLFHTGDDGSIKSFSSVYELNKFSSEKKFDIYPEGGKYNFNIIIEWLEKPNDIINCNLFLDTWNIIADLAHSIHEPFYGDADGADGEILHVYNKLFYGCNFPAVNTSGKDYIPVWPEDEIIILSQVLKEGIGIVNKCFV